jgi:hypothetical protein
MEDSTEKTIVTDSGYVKLSKNSRGHTWDIKVLIGTKKEDYETLIKWVKELDNELEEAFGPLKIGA